MSFYCKIMMLLMSHADKQQTDQLRQLLSFGALMDFLSLQNVACCGFFWVFNEESHKIKNRKINN